MKTMGMSIDIEKVRSFINDGASTTISKGYALDVLLKRTSYQPPLIIKWREAFYNFATILYEDCEGSSIKVLIEDVDKYTSQLYVILRVLHDDDVLLKMFLNFSNSLLELKSKL